MKTKQQRINTIIGQLEGIKEMITKEEPCINQLTQLKAAKSSISSLMDSIVEEQLHTCLSQLKTKDKKTLLNLKKYVTNN